MPYYVATSSGHLTYRNAYPSLVTFLTSTSENLFVVPVRVTLSDYQTTISDSEKKVFLREFCKQSTFFRRKEEDVFPMTTNDVRYYATGPKYDYLISAEYKTLPFWADL